MQNTHQSGHHPVHLKTSPADKNYAVDHFLGKIQRTPLWQWKWGELHLEQSLTKTRHSIEPK